MLPALLLTTLLATPSVSGVPSSVGPVPGDPPPALAPLAGLVGGSWVGEGTWTEGGPFFARHVFEWGLGKQLLRIRSYARHDGQEVPLFETILAPASPGGSELTLFCAAAFGTTYRGTAVAEPGELEEQGAGPGGLLLFEYEDANVGRPMWQAYELAGDDGFHWISEQQGEDGRELLAEIDFRRSAFVPLPPATHAVRAEAIVRAPLEEVWEAWTTEEGLASFFASSVKLDLRVGGEYEVYFAPDAPAGQRGAEGTRVLAIDPGRMLAFTWDATPAHAVRGQNTAVTVRLEPVGPGRTRVTLTNSGFGEGSDWPEARAYFEKAWTSVLENLTRRFEREAQAGELAR